MDIFDRIRKLFDKVRELFDTTLEHYIMGYDFAAGRLLRGESPDLLRAFVEKTAEDSCDYSPYDAGISAAIEKYEELFKYEKALQQDDSGDTEREVQIRDEDLRNTGLGYPS